MGLTKAQRRLYKAGLRRRRQELADYRRSKSGIGFFDWLAKRFGRKDAKDGAQE